MKPEITYRGMAMRTNKELATVIQVGEREAMERLRVQSELAYHVRPSELPDIFIRPLSISLRIFRDPSEKPLSVPLLSSSLHRYAQLRCRSCTLQQVLCVRSLSALLIRPSVHFPL